MITTDTIIVGGGPAGSSCAWKLNRAGRDCLVLDRETFPRTKLCAGWITPEVVEDLEMDPETYPHSFMTFPAMHVHIFGLSFAIPVPQHSIRRYEFDRWLLERSGAEVANHYVQDIRREGGFYVIDGTYRCTYLVGAGGTRCPVYRKLFAPAAPRSGDMQVVALEQELPYHWHNGECHLWFFQGGLRGYSWYGIAAHTWWAPAAPDARSTVRCSPPPLPAPPTCRWSRWNKNFPTTGTTASVICGSSRAACAAIHGTYPRPAAT